MNPSQGLITAAEHLQLVLYFNCASTAVFVYDYFVTLPSEVALVWAAPLSWMKVLFLITRYLPLADLTMRIYHRVLHNPDAETCRLIFTTSFHLFYVGMALAEVILTLRTWAVWNRDRKLGIGLAILFAFCWVPDVPIVIKMTKSLAFSPEKMPDLLGCFPVASSNITLVCWFLLLLYEAVMLFLMLIQGIKCYNGGGTSQLFYVVFRNGLLYYLILFVCSLANVVVVCSVPVTLRPLLGLAERFIHPVIACRVVLDIRGEVLNVNREIHLVETTESARATDRSRRPSF